MAIEQPRRRRRRALPQMQNVVRSRSAQRMPQAVPKGMEGRLPSQQRRRMPNGNAYGLRRNLGMPTLDGGPNPAAARDTGGFHTLPGGQPGPNTQPNPNTFPPGTVERDPNSLIGQEGHDPLAHRRYWANQGWLVRNNGEGYRYAGDDALRRYLTAASGNPAGGGPIGGQPGPNTGGQTGGGGPNGGGGGGTGGGGGGAGGGGAGGGQGGPAGLPLDPVYEQQYRHAQDALNAQLAAFAPQRAQIQAMQELMAQRLGTNENLDRRAMLEMLNERGALGGSIESTDRANLGTDYLRQYQDLGTQTAESLGNIALNEADARSMFLNQIAEYLAQSAARTAADPNTPSMGGGGGGDGGGNWEPTWKPRNQRRRRGGR